MERNLVTLLFSLAAVIYPAASYANTVVVGLPEVPASGSCFPFGCPDIPGFGLIPEFQQIYAGSAFGSGAILISGITFFDTQLPGGSIDQAIYAFSLSTSPMSVDSLSATPSDNIGADNSAFFSGVLSGPLTDGMLTVAGTPFSYDPANGDLLLTILISNPARQRSSSIFMDVSDGTADTTTMLAVTTRLGPELTYGLITQFDYSSASSSTPEPSSVSLLGTAVLLFLFSRRKVRART